MSEASELVVIMGATIPTSLMGYNKTMNYKSRIEVNQAVMAGKPVIKGTRIGVDMLLRQLATGMTVQEILDNYPHLHQQDIQAAIAYAGHLVEEESVYPLDKQNHGKTKTVAG